MIKVNLESGVVDVSHAFTKPIHEQRPVGRERLGRVAPVTQGEFAPTVINDGRRLGPQNQKDIGFQTPYLSLLPPGTAIDVYWSGGTADPMQAQKALTDHLRYRKTQNEIILLTGGEHLDPDTTGSTIPINEEGLLKYGGFDPARDRVTLELVRHAEVINSPLIAICRGGLAALYHYSDKLAIPLDHKQEAHKSPDGINVVEHGVKDVLPAQIKNSLVDKVPVITTVNSGHHQGLKVAGVSDQAMVTLNKNGVFPWLVADIPGVDDSEQVYEGWVQIADNRVVSVLTQFHPERQYDKDGATVRDFIKSVMMANLKVPRSY